MALFRVPLKAFKSNIQGVIGEFAFFLRAVSEVAYPRITETKQYCFFVFPLVEVQNEIS